MLVHCHYCHYEYKHCRRYYQPTLLHYNIHPLSHHAFSNVPAVGTPCSTCLWNVDRLATTTLYSYSETGTPGYWRFVETFSSVSHEPLARHHLVSRQVVPVLENKRAVYQAEQGGDDLCRNQSALSDKPETLMSL